MRKSRFPREIIMGVLIFSILLSGFSGCARSKRRVKPDKDIASSTAGKYAKRVKFISAADLKEDRWAVESYRIDVDDLIEISVWQIEDLHREAVVRPDGKISFPLIGDVHARGKTIEELREEIADKIKLYIKVPQVAVTIKEFGGKKAVVLGNIGSPGVIRFTTPIRMSEAIGLAGDFDAGAADRGSVYVIRDLPGDQPTIIVSDVTKILYQGDLREDIVIKQGDIIYVQKSVWSSVKEFMDGIFATVVKYAETYYGIPLWRRYIFEDTRGRRWKYKSGFGTTST